MPRATTAACEVLPPRLVRMPCAAIMPFEVVGVGLAPDQDHVLARLRPLDRGGRVEHDLADGGAGRGVDARRELHRIRLEVEAREHQLRQLAPAHPGQRLVHVDEALVDELGGDAERGRGGALADAGLQHPELAALDGELDVAQVLVVLLERAHHVAQLVVGALVDLLEIGERDGVADAGDDVLALRVLQVVAVDPLRARGRVAGERDAGAGGHVEVAEDHRAHVDGGAEIGRDALLAAVDHGPLGVPRVEHRPDGQVHLLARVLRERPPRLLDDHLLERLDELAQVLAVEVEIRRRALGVLGRLQRVLEVLAGDAQDGLAEHLDQPAVGVEGEALVTGLGREPAHRLVVQPDVEDRLHHPGHRELGPRADARPAAGRRTGRGACPCRPRARPGAR